MNKYLISFTNCNGEKRKIDVYASSEEKAKAFVRAVFTGSRIYRVEF